MAIIKSAKKALRQNIKRRARNTVYKESLKDLIRELKSLIEKKDLQAARNLLPRVYKALDKTAKVGVIKRNAADRNKSRLTKLIDRTK
ncbi:30S ribosomal protein S20 [Patescibacteria group bacterium]|nr:30S ribosomal protein S20 [Patescibacteria group bacterium]